MTMLVVGCFWILASICTSEGDTQFGLIGFFGLVCIYFGLVGSVKCISVRFFSVYK